MKIAVCFSGGVRYPENGLKSLEKFSHSDITLFGHTWNLSEKKNYLKTVAGSKDKNLDDLVKHDFSSLSDYNFESLLVQCYETREVEFNQIYKDLKFKEYPDTSIGSVGLISMHYSIAMSNLLKKEYERRNGMEFDIVVRMRYDSDIQSPVNFSSVLYPLYIPFGEDWLGGINDQFAIGTTSAMDIYSNLFLSLSDYTECKYHSETLLREHLRKNNLFAVRNILDVKINNGNDFRKNYPKKSIDKYMQQYSPDYYQKDLAIVL